MAAGHRPFLLDWTRHPREILSRSSTLEPTAGCCQQFRPSDYSHLLSCRTASYLPLGKSSWTQFGYYDLEASQLSDATAAKRTSIPSAMPADPHRQRATSLLGTIAEDIGKYRQSYSNGRRSLSDSFRKSREDHRRQQPVLAEGNSRLSSSDELEMSTLSSAEEEEDEETGLTGQERRERRRRKKRNTQLDERLAGDGATERRGGSDSKAVEDAVSRNVTRALITNAILIGSWYCFSLSISLVGDPTILTHEKSARLTDPVVVQQMDVLTKASELQFPSIHYLRSHARSVLLSMRCSIFCSKIPTGRNLGHPARRSSNPTGQ